MSPKQQPTSASGFLLLVALLFGIVTMHTLGHPQEHGGGPAPSAHAPVADTTGPGEAHAATRGTAAGPPPHAGAGPAVGNQAVAHADAGPMAVHHVVAGPGTGPLAAHQAAPHAGARPLTASHAIAHAGVGAMAVNDVVAGAGTGPLVAHQAAPHAGAQPLTARHLVARTASPPGSPSHDTGMDPMSVCLAVLGGALVLALFGTVAARPPAAAPVLLPAGLRAAPWPEPPPPRALLARLSVLRI
ncbi:hypothetical protein [Streptomyces sp. NPDC047071]|uniref:hypothetical protein n=1 Tax=Streptomyces sp. NPDC047071 TaxID=3154808 RepID=UPI003453997D